MLTELIAHPYTQALGWALVHFVWQGAAIGLLAFVFFKFTRASASTRYAVGVATMAVLLVAPIATFLWLANRPIEQGGVALVDPAPLATGVSLTVADEPIPALPATDSATIRSTTPTFVLSAWAAGVVFFSLRLAGGWLVACRLARRSTRPVTDEIQALAHRVAGRLAIGRIVSVLESTSVSVPLMIGWLKPAVLLPAAALSGLSPTQIEALLAHELAHVRRHDYLVNLLQSVVETLLFYHPAVWWVSRQVRKEREHCCDDLAVAVCDRLVYVTALADLASMTVTPRLALAATDGSLIRRVRRILGAGPSSDSREPASSWLPLSFVVLLLGALVPVATQTVPPAEVRPATAIVVEVPTPRAAPSPHESRRAVAEVPRESVTSSTLAKAQEERPVEAVAAQEIETVAAAKQEKAKVELQRLSETIEGLRKKIDAIVRGTTDDATLLAIQEDLKKLDEQLRQSAGAGREEEQLKAKSKAAMQVAELQAMAEVVKKKMAAEGFDKTREMKNEDRAKEVMAKAEKMKVEEAMAANGGEFKKQLDQRAFEAMDSAKMALVAEKVEEIAMSSEALVLRDRARAGLSKDGGSFFSDVKNLRSDREKRRVIEAVVSAKEVSDDAVTAAIKTAAGIQGETERANALMIIARRQALTPDMVQAYISATSSIQSEENRARVLAQPVRLKEKGR